MCWAWRLRQSPRTPRARRLASGSPEQTDGYFIRRLATDHGIPLITNVQLAKRLVEAMIMEEVSSLPILSWPAVLDAR